MRTIEELQNQIKQHEDRIFEISQQVRALAWETKQRTESIKNLKREIKLVKREARKEWWRKKLGTQQDIKALLAIGKHNPPMAPPPNLEPLTKNQHHDLHESASNLVRKAIEQ